MPECPGDQAPLETPIACSLRGDDLRRRQRRLGDALQRAVALERSPSGVTAAFASDPELEAELRALARAESECCPFLRIAVRRAGEMLVFEVVGPAEARPVIDEMFGGSLRPPG
jgi:hypothetical protein